MHAAGKAKGVFSMKQFALPPNFAASSADILEALGFGVAIIDADNHQIVYANNTLLNLSGQTPDTLLGQSCHQLLCPAQQGACPISDLGRTIDNSERLLLRADGQKIPIIKTVLPLTLAGKKYLMESIIDNTTRKEMCDLLSAANENLKREIDNRRQAEEQLQGLAYHDTLTGLPNRAFFLAALDHAIAVAERSAAMLAILFLDLDGFKTINDTLGHASGDKLLAETAKRLVATVRKGDIVARIGGDEFVILCESIAHPEAVKAITDKIVASFDSAFNINGQEVFITTSLGAALYPTNGHCAEELLQNADSAMYKAKELGRNQSVLCTQQMQQDIYEYMQLSNHLYRALERHELILHYQPQIHSDSYKIIGAEALVRWKHPVLGLLPPGKFIPIAEKTGLIHAIGEWVVRTACRQNKAWQDAGLPKIPVTVNLSILQLNKPSFVQQIDAILAETGLEAQYLELELTESIVMHDLLTTVKALAALRKRGIAIAVDDFGAEHASLQYLTQLPIDKIKIAKPFVQGMEANKKDAAIANAMLEMAKKMGVRAIATGIETQQQVSLLKHAQCQEMQGFYFSKPLPAEDLARLLANGLSASFETA